MQHIRRFQDQREIREQEENQVLLVSKEKKEALGHLVHLDQKETLVTKGALDCQD